MSNITNAEYWAKVASIAAQVVEQAAQNTECDSAGTFDRDTITDELNDSVLHEAIDSHQWVIYNTYNLDVLQHTRNEDYMIDNLGLESAGESLKSGLSTLHCHLAFWALYADVQDYIDSALDEYEAELPSSEESEE